MTDTGNLDENPPASECTVVLRCPSSARYKPEEGQEFFLREFPGFDGDMRVRVRTRWLDQGHEAPLPRELWFECKCSTDSLDSAMSGSLSATRMLCSLIAFAANVRTGTPEVHIAFDSTAGRQEREFLEVFLPDEQGLPREGRLVVTAELTALFGALTSSDEVKRLSRALYQYERSLRYWYYGGEWLALAHLYMAVEALTKSVIRDRCGRDGIDEAELARRNGVDPDDPERPRWRPALDAWARRELIFQADTATYEAAKDASDGMEHGFMDFSEVNRRAAQATESTFRYVREAMVHILALDQDSYSDLITRPARDVGSLRKMVRGKFIGTLDDIAPAGEEYPYLEWRSNVRTMTRTGDEFKMTFDETFKVHCHPDAQFQGTAFEVKGRAEPGAEPVNLEAVQEIQARTTTGATQDDVSSLLSQALQFASAIGNEIGSGGVPPLRGVNLSRFSMQVALFEALHLLVADDRPVEAMALAHPLIRNTCLLQLTAELPGGLGIGVQTKIDSLERARVLYDHQAINSRVERETETLRRLAAEAGITLPDAVPDLEAAPFYADHTNDAVFVHEVTKSDDVAMQLHTEMVGEMPAFHTQVTDASLRVGVATLAVAALTASTVALAEICEHAIDRDRVDELLRMADEMEEKAEAARREEAKPNTLIP